MRHTYIMEPNTTPQQIPTQQVAPLKQNVSIALAFLVFILIGVASYFGYKNYQLKQQISQIELSRVSPASASPTVSPSPTIVKTADQKEVKVNRGNAVVAYEPPLSNQEYVSERNTIEQKIVAQINQGLLVLLGIEEEDALEDANWLVSKIVNLRIFADENDVMNLSVKDIDGEIIVVSQFTLHASTKKGNRPFG